MGSHSGHTPRGHALRLHLAARRFGLEEVGFRYVASGPLVRSSYKAGEFFLSAMIRQDRGLPAAAHT